MLKEKPMEGVEFSASLAPPNKNPAEGAEVSFSSGFAKVKVEVTCVDSLVAVSPNLGAAGLVSVTSGLPNTGMAFAAADVVVVETVCKDAGASFFSALDWGTENVNGELELPFSVGLAPNDKVEFSELAA